MTKRKHEEEETDELSGFSSIVVETGAWKASFGYSGMHDPEYVVPSCYVEGEKGKEYGMRGLALPREGEVGEGWDAEGLARVVLSMGDAMPVVLVDPPDITQDVRKERMETFIETHGIPAVGLVLDACCVPYACGVDRGIVMDIGHTGTRFTTVVDGYVLTKPSTRSEFGAAACCKNWEGIVLEKMGRPLLTEVEYLKKSVNGEPKRFTSPSELSLAQEATHLNRTLAMHSSYRDILRKRAFHKIMESLAVSNEEESESVWELPDMSSITLTGKERKALGDVYFQGKKNVVTGEMPRGVGVCKLEETGHFHPEYSFQSLIQKCIYTVEPALRPRLADNVLLKGGGTRQPGFHDRLQSELSKIFSVYVKPNVSSFRHCGSKDAPDVISWTGASIISSMTSYIPNFISKQQWEEEGPNVIATRLPFAPGAGK